MRSNDEHFEPTIRKTKECCSYFGFHADFENRCVQRQRAPFDVNNPATNANDQLKIDVLDATITALDTRFNDTTVGELKSITCLSPAIIIEQNNDAPSETCWAEFKTLCQFYFEDLSSDSDMTREYKNMHALLNAWDFDEIEDLLIFLGKQNLTAQFENLTTLLKIALTLPVSSAHDEWAFSCLKPVKTYLQSTMTEQHLSNLACIAINCKHVLHVAVRDLQKPFLNARTRKIFNLRYSQQNVKLFT